MRVNRQGDHYKAAITHPPLVSAENGRVFVARLIRAKSEGLRIPYPLLGVDQSGLGAPVASIGGAGKYDAIFLTGLLAVLLAGWWSDHTVAPQRGGRWQQSTPPPFPR